VCSSLCDPYVCCLNPRFLGSNFPVFHRFKPISKPVLCCSGRAALRWPPRYFCPARGRHRADDPRWGPWFGASHLSGGGWKWMTLNWLMEIEWLIAWWYVEITEIPSFEYKIDILPMIVTPFDLSNLQEKHVFYLCFSIHNRDSPWFPRSWIVIPIVFLGMVSMGPHIINNWGFELKW